MEDLKFETDWNLKLLFNDESEIGKYRNEVEEKVNKFISKWESRNDYLEKPEVLREALDEYSLLEIVGPSGGDGAGTKDSFYYWLKSQQNQNDTEIKAKYGKSIEFANKLSNKLRFFKLNISKIPPEKQESFLTNERLNNYKHFIKRGFAESKYLLNVEEENIISLKQTPAHEHWDKLVSGLLSKQEREVIDNSGKKSKKNFSEILSLLNSTEKKVRDDAAISFNEIIEKYSEIAEAEINAILTNKKIDDDLRKVQRPDFLRHLADDIESEVVDAMLEAVEKRYDLSRKFYELKARLFGLERLEYHERNVPYDQGNKKYLYKDSVELVRKVFLDLDKDFFEIFNKLNASGQVDAFPKKGKRSGAFCTDSLLYQPTYVLLNHTDELKDVLIIAHEFGHAINGELMKKNCNTLTCGMALSTAEVASTFMEDFVFKQILKESDEEEKFSLMFSKLNDLISTIVRQVACYKFEQELHNEFRKKGYLSKEEIGKIFQKHMAAYMGPFVEQSPGSENWWVHWHHIRSFFYVYSYASGLLISMAMQNEVKKNPQFIEKVKEFLSSGLSDSSKNIFLKLGIDITKKEFWSSGLNEIEILLDETEKLAKKLNKI